MFFCESSLNSSRWEFPFPGKRSDQHHFQSSHQCGWTSGSSASSADLSHLLTPTLTLLCFISYNFDRLRVTESQSNSRFLPQKTSTIPTTFHTPGLLFIECYKVSGLVEIRTVQVFQHTKDRDVDKFQDGGIPPTKKNKKIHNQGAN